MRDANILSLNDTAQKDGFLTPLDGRQGNCDLCGASTDALLEWVQARRARIHHRWVALTSWDPPIKSRAEVAWMIEADRGRLALDDACAVATELRARAELPTQLARQMRAETNIAPEVAPGAAGATTEAVVRENMCCPGNFCCCGEFGKSEVQRDAEAHSAGGDRAS